MVIAILYKAIIIWLVIACLAVVNGALRETMLTPLVGSTVSLPLSGITLSLIIFAATYLSIGFIGADTVVRCWQVGALWVLMTLAFEFLFGHYVAGKSWMSLVQVFNLVCGNLFALALLTCLISPYFTARLKGLI